MSTETQRILAMVADKKITTEEAEKLLRALNSAPGSGQNETFAAKKYPKFLRVQVEPQSGSSKGERVNIKVPFQLLRSGIKLASLVPAGVQGRVDSALKENGIDVDLSRIKKDDLEELIEQLSEITIDVDSDNEKVRIFCE